MIFYNYVLFHLKSPHLKGDELWKSFALWGSMTGMDISCQLCCEIWMSCSLQLWQGCYFFLYYLSALGGKLKRTTSITINHRKYYWKILTIFIECAICYCPLHSTEDKLTGPHLENKDFTVSISHMRTCICVWEGERERESVSMHCMHPVH